MLRRTRGFLLLPVALTLVAVGALAYAMTRDAGMNVTGVDAEYDTDVARYLAEGALNLARWNNNVKCGSDPITFGPTILYRYNLTNKNVGTAVADQVGTMTMNASSVVKDNSSNDKGNLAADVSGTTTSATPTRPAASLRITRSVVRYNLTNKRTATMSGNGAGANTTISTGSSTPPATGATMELTDNGAGNQSYGLLRFNLNALPRNALVKDATLRLKYTDADLFPLLLTRRIDIYRVTSAWGATAIWTLPWSKPGGDYAAGAVDGSSLLVYGYGYYPLSIDALVAGWVDGTIANYGVLLKPTDVSRAHFPGFASDTDGPQLTVNYYERCN